MELKLQLQIEPLVRQPLDCKSGELRCPEGQGQLRLKGVYWTPHQHQKRRGGGGGRAQLMFKVDQVGLSGLWCSKR